MTTLPQQPVTEQPVEEPATFSWLTIGAAYLFAIAAWVALATMIIRQSLP